MEYIDYVQEGGAFELPLAGATGYAAIITPVYDSDSNIVLTLEPGQGFTIVREEGEWWHIAVDTVSGWVISRYCFVNLPDIIPSIVYNNTNTYASLFRSSGYDIPNITGRALYGGRDFNARLGRVEYIAPVIYGMAPKIFAAQQAAIAEGNTLVIYEAFRPADAHNELHLHFSQLVEDNPTVRAGITADSFNIRWFLAESPYNHQRGTAIDTSLARIERLEMRNAGNYRYLHITQYLEYPMQTPLHELSVASAIFDSTVHARSTTAWIGAEVSAQASPGTLLMLRYCTEAGLIPLASEWWHYNDLINTALAIDMDITGEFHIEKTHSRAP